MKETVKTAGVIKAKRERGRGCGPVSSVRVMNLFYVNGLAVGVKRALDSNLFAFVLLQLFLAVDVIGLAAGILQNVLVARLGNGSAEALAVTGRLRLRVGTGLAGWRLAGAGLLAGTGLLARRSLAG